MLKPIWALGESQMRYHQSLEEIFEHAQQICSLVEFHLYDRCYVMFNCIDINYYAYELFSVFFAQML
ncbi:hypothetical protein C7H79_17390 [Nitrosomonas supralitoralis]|uniref:Uncharacterized protein n=1 Tax=Nitrosomonas supralitoralis TaxID=2116706 RepID=A0A2P7NQK0_9PROT|nr:hypothetical protein C7H79_17390 [Nitrosomonas supralitoralis]